MMRKAIVSFNMPMEDGFTLIELVVVLMIIATLTLLGVPAMNHIRETAARKAYAAEAEMVCTAVGAYLAEESLNGTIDEMEIYEKLLIHPLGSAGNPLTNRIDGYTKGAKIVSVQYKTATMSFEGIFYRVGGYEFQVYPGDGDPKVEVIKKNK